MLSKENYEDLQINFHPSVDVENAKIIKTSLKISHELQIELFLLLFQSLLSLTVVEEGNILSRGKCRLWRWKIDNKQKKILANIYSSLNFLRLLEFSICVMRLRLDLTKGKILIKYLRRQLSEKGNQTEELWFTRHPSRVTSLIIFWCKKSTIANLFKRLIYSQLAKTFRVTCLLLWLWWVWCP